MFDHLISKTMPTPGYAIINPPRTDLTEKEHQENREWARQHYRPGQPINAYWHPSVIAECLTINEEYTDPLITRQQHAADEAALADLICDICDCDPCACDDEPDWAGEVTGYDNGPTFW